MYSNKGKDTFGGGPGPPSFPSSGGAIVTMHPASVSLKKVRTALITHFQPERSRSIARFERQQGVFQHMPSSDTNPHTNSLSSCFSMWEAEPRAALLA